MRLRFTTLPFVLILALSATIAASARGADAVDGQSTAQESVKSPWKLSRNVEYARIAGQSLKLDLYLPRQISADCPLVIWIHGGGWRKGSKDACRMTFLVEQGFAVASIEYRLSQEAAFPAQIQDCKAAVRFLRAHAGEYGFDGGRIGVAGASAGGHLAALLGTTANVPELEGDPGNAGNAAFPSDVQAVADYFGPTDLVQVANSEWDNPKGAVYPLMGGKVADHLDLARLASPLFHVSRQSAPFLILHGDKDATVPITDSERLAKKLKKAGASVDLHILKDQKHGGEEFFTPEMQELVTAFFRKNLRQSIAIPTP